MRRFFEEKDAIQGWNSLKYFAIVVSFVTRTAYSKNDSTGWYIVAWVTSVVAGVVATYWDIVYDWGLLNRKSTNPWLRDKLIVPYKSVYFAAIVSFYSRFYVISHFQLTFFKINEFSEFGRLISAYDL